jgi:hypothetical protein
MALWRTKPDRDLRTLARALGKCQARLIMTRTFVRGYRPGLPVFMTAPNVMDDFLERCWLARCIKDAMAIRDDGWASLEAFALDNPKANVEEIRACLDRLAKDAELLAAVMERENLQWSDYQRKELMAIVERLTDTFTSAAIGVDELLTARSRHLVPGTHLPLG